jgi:hypothetical protein
MRHAPRFADERSLAIAVRDHAEAFVSGLAEEDDFAPIEAAARERVGQVLAGRYRLDELLGIGGMGAVFKGFHLGLRRPVAIKLLHTALARDPQVSKRFDREAHSVSRLEHPNCVQVTDFGTTEDGIKYLVMQYLEGEELAALLEREGALPLTRATALILQILQGLAHAHRQGVAHRDLKPENVFVTTDHEGRETLKLVDFGISKVTSGPGSDNLTRAGLVFGTPHYMSPEQALGQPSDQRADIYAAGILFFRMLTGALPFTGDDPIALIRMQVTQALPALPPSVPAAVAALVERMTAKSSDERIGSADEVIAALESGGAVTTVGSAAPAGADASPSATVVAMDSSRLALPATADARAPVRRQAAMAAMLGCLGVLSVLLLWSLVPTAAAIELRAIALPDTRDELMGPRGVAAPGGIPDSADAGGKYLAVRAGGGRCGGIPERPAGACGRGDRPTRGGRVVLAAGGTQAARPEEEEPIVGQQRRCEEEAQEELRWLRVDRPQGMLAMRRFLAQARARARLRS